MIHTVNSFGVVNKTEVDVFWSSLAFSMIQRMSIVLSKLISKKKLISASQNHVSPFMLLCNRVVCVCQCVYNTSPCQLGNSYIIISNRCLTIPLNGYIFITLIKPLLQDIRFFKCQTHKWHCTKHFYSYTFFFWALAFTHWSMWLLGGAQYTSHNITQVTILHKPQYFQAPMSPTVKRKQPILIS